MLPFLAKKRQTGLIVENRKPDEAKDDQQDSSDLEMCTSDIMQAIEMKDKKRLQEALEAFFEIKDSMPHEEGEHYDAQNQKAAQEENE